MSGLRYQTAAEMKEELEQGSALPQAPEGKRWLVSSVGTLQSCFPLLPCFSSSKSRKSMPVLCLHPDGPPGADESRVEKLQQELSKTQKRKWKA